MVDLVVENGSGVTGANTYVTVEETVTTLEGLGRASFGEQDEDKQKSDILNAALYLNIAFTWGLPLSVSQTMGLPSTYWDGIPANVKTAQILLAYEASQGELLPSTTGQTISEIEERFEGIGSTRTKYQDGSFTGRRFPLVDGLLLPLTSRVIGSSIQTARRLIG